MTKSSPWRYCPRFIRQHRRFCSSHHYFETDAELIYDVCINHIDELAQAINKMIKEIS